MSTLTKCADELCDPVVQVRGSMGPGDYFGVISDGSSGVPPGQPDVDHHTIVEVHDGNRNDCRIACRKCALATPWSPKDLPNMPGAGEAYTRDTVWTQLITNKNTKAEMLAVLMDKFGAAALKKFFKHSL